MTRFEHHRRAAIAVHWIRCLRAVPLAAASLLALAATPSQACSAAHAVLGLYSQDSFFALIPAGITLSNIDPAGCHAIYPLYVEYGATFRNKAGLSNEPGSIDGPNGRGGILVGGLFDNEVGATVVNSGEFHVGRPVDLRGVLKNAGQFTNTGLLDVSSLLDNTGSLNNAGSLVLSGTLANSRQLYNTGTLTTLGTLANTGTLTNQGTLQFARSPNLFPPKFSNAGGVIENRVGATMDFTNVNLVSGTWAGGTVTNYGTVRAIHLVTGDPDSGTVVLTSWGTLENSSLTNLAGHTQVNDGKLTHSLLRINGGTVVNNGLIWRGSSIEIGSLDGGTLRNTGQIEMDGATLRNVGQLTNTGYVIVRAGGRIENGVRVSDTNFGHLQNDGNLQVESGGVVVNATTIDSTASLYNAGLIDNQGPGSRVSNSGRFDNLGTFTSPTTLVNTGTMVNSGDFRVDHGFTLGGIFINSGQMIFGAESVTSGTGSYSQQAGATRVDGGIDVSSFTVTAGSLCGSGTIRGSVVIRNGTVCPGNSPGTLRIGGNLRLFDSTIEIEIAGTAPGSFDVLQVDGTATFAGGTLKLNFAEGYLPLADAHWAFLASPNGLAGLQSLTVEVSGLPTGYVAAIGADGQLAFSSAPVPEPGSLASMAAGLAGIMFLLRRRGSRSTVRGRWVDVPSGLRHGVRRQGRPL